SSTPDCVLLRSRRFLARLGRHDPASSRCRGYALERYCLPLHEGEREPGLGRGGIGSCSRTLSLCSDPPKSFRPVLPSHFPVSGEPERRSLHYTGDPARGSALPGFGARPGLARSLGNRVGAQVPCSFVCPHVPGGVSSDGVYGHAPCRCRCRTPCLCCWTGLRSPGGLVPVEPSSLSPCRPRCGGARAGASCFPTQRGVGQ